MEKRCLAASIFTIKNIYERFPSDIEHNIQNLFNSIIDEQSLTITIDTKELQLFVSTIHSCFGDSSNSCDLLPTKILWPYAFISLKIISHIYVSEIRIKHIQTIIRTLSNRNEKELQTFLAIVVKSDLNEIQKILCKNIHCDQFVVKEFNTDRGLMENVIIVIKSCNDTLLLSNIFLECLKIIQFSDHELYKLKYKLQTLSLISELLANKITLRYVMNNCSNIMSYLFFILNSEKDNEIIYIILSLLKEFIDCCNYELRQNILKSLEVVANKHKNPNIQ